MGWYGEPNVKTKNELVNVIKKSYNNEFISSSISDDHFWILHKINNYVSATCYLISNDKDEYSYKPISIESGPKYYDIPRDWLDKITDVKDRENGIYDNYLKKWLNTARLKNGLDIKAYDFKELNSEKIYTGKINQLNHLVVSDPHYGKDVWCRYDKKFNKINDWNIKLIIKNTDYYDVYNDYALNMNGVEFTLLLKNNMFKNIDRMIDINSTSTSYSKIFKHSETQIGMDTAQVALGINEYAKEINDYYKDYDNDSLDLDGYRPYFSIKTLTDGIFGSVTEYSYGGKEGAIVLTGWIDGDTGYNDERILNYLTERLKIEELQKINISQKEERKEIDGPKLV